MDIKFITQNGDEFKLPINPDEEKNVKELFKSVSKRTEQLKKDLKDLIEAIYEISCVGGALHIVLDDGNLKDKDIQWCIDNSIKKCDNIVERVLCLECAKLLLSLPYELRDEWTRGE